MTAGPHGTEILRGELPGTPYAICTASMDELRLGGGRSPSDTRA